MLPGVSHSTSLTHPNLKVTYIQAECKERTLYVVEGVAPSISLGVNNADIRTLETALLTRMYFCEVDGVFVEPPVVDGKFVMQELKAFKRKLCELVGFPTRISLEQVVEMYTGRKKTIYNNALISLDQSPLERKDAFSLAFTKCEKVNPEKAPRCIQPRKPRYNLQLASFLKHLEHRIYRAIKKMFGDGPTVIKGYDVRRVARIMTGKWNSFRRPVAVGLDAVKFDMHVSPQVLGWEHSVYLFLYRNDPFLKMLLDWQLNNIGLGFCEDGKLYYKVSGKRFSGDINTALGNCLIMCAIVWSLARTLAIHLKLMNNGDDCQVFMESEDLPKFQAAVSDYFLKFGFRLTCEEPVYNLAEVEFCQMHCIRTANGPVMVRNIQTALSKDSMCTNDLRGKGGKKWLYAVGECGMALCSGVPVMQDYYMMLCRSGTRSDRYQNNVTLAASGMRMMRGRLESKMAEITPEARHDVDLAWGITPDAQVAYEKLYSEMLIDTTQVRTASDMSEVSSLLM